MITNKTSTKVSGGDNQRGGVETVNPGAPHDFADGNAAPAPYLTAGMDGSGYIGVDQVYRNYAVETSRPLPAGKSGQMLGAVGLEEEPDDYDQKDAEDIAPALRAVTDSAEKTAEKKKK